MKIYVAGKWEEKERVREVMNQLRAAGHIITYDWTSYEGGLTQEQAVFDLEGVRKADAFVGVFEKDLPYQGSLVEMGAAMVLGTPVHILGNTQDNCIFLLLPNVKRGLEGLLNDNSSAVSN